MKTGLSSYPLHILARWLYDYLNPGFKTSCVVNALPPAQTFKSLDRNQYYSLVFFGDMMSMNSLKKIPLLDKSYTAIFNNADLIIGNIEAPITSLTGANKSLARFCISLEFLETFLRNLSIEHKEKLLLNIANNHISDYGMVGFSKTEEILEGHQYNYIGTKKRPFFKFNNLGIFSWTNHVNVPDECLKFVSDYEDYTSLPELKDEHSLTKLIAFPHWGYEFQHYPEAHVKEMALDAHHNGFDYIIGHHPHVLRPIEMLEDGKLCFYSIGNLNGPDAFYVNDSVKLSSFFELQIEKTTGSLCGYKNHFFFNDGKIIKPIDKIKKVKLKAKLQKNINRLFPISDPR